MHQGFVLLTSVIRLEHFDGLLISASRLLRRKISLRRSSDGLSMIENKHLLQFPGAGQMKQTRLRPVATEQE
jgi:hypothetical protein